MARPERFELEAFCGLERGHCNRRMRVYNSVNGFAMMRHKTDVGERSKQPKAKKRPVHLYWVETEDHGEDWFIFARNRRSAQAYHADYEGYDTGDAYAEMILHDVGYRDDLPVHAQLEDLERLGFKVISTGDQFIRQVEYNGRVFTEGLLESMAMEATDSLAESMGQGRPCKTTRHIRN